MRLVLQRDLEGPSSTMGMLFVDDATDRFCFTLEPGPNAKDHPPIPVGGPYDVTIEYSPKFQRDMPHVLGTGRIGILIHPGNWATDTLGCILVGREREPGKQQIDHSVPAYESLFALIKAALERGEKVTLEVRIA